MSVIERDKRRWTLYSTGTGERATVDSGPAIRRNCAVRVMPVEEHDQQLRGAEDRIAILEMALEMATDDASRFTVAEYVAMAERKLANVFDSDEDREKKAQEIIEAELKERCGGL